MMNDVNHLFFYIMMSEENFSFYVFAAIYTKLYYMWCLLLELYFVICSKTWEDIVAPVTTHIYFSRLVNRGTKTL